MQSEEAVLCLSHLRWKFAYQRPQHLLSRCARISPTKTLEYLAAGKPVVSTAIRDVVQPYGQQGLVWTANTASEFARAIDSAMSSERSARIAQGDSILGDVSWDRSGAKDVFSISLWEGGRKCGGGAAPS